MFGLDTLIFILLVISVLAVCVFEFVNGFHDTANAVATVIYTNSLKPNQAVIWSGIVNFIGLLTGGVGVTMSIIGLLPAELLSDSSLAHAVPMAFAILLTAIIWNLGTWYFGIPASSSHTLIGSIIGVGLGWAAMPGGKGFASMPWAKMQEIGFSLLLSPLFGCALAIVFMYILRKAVSNKLIFKEPEKDSPPPMWIRAILFLTCTMVSFFHGRNDGQKGIGLLMIILIAFLPGYFAINSEVNPVKLMPDVEKVQSIVSKIDTSKLSVTEVQSYHKVLHATQELTSILQAEKGKVGKELSTERKLNVRKDVLDITKNAKKLYESDAVNLIPAEIKELKKLTAGDKAPFFTYGNNNKGLSGLTDFAPNWAMWLIALSLGLGTMIGWKRIVVTIGEKIGKQHLTYAQGASAELVASITIGLATAYKWPVSTTHVLSSGIAGSMIASKGIKNLQGGTIKNILTAWVLTLPVTVILSATLFVLFRWITG
jgi:phosphate/sulfate permease